MNPRNIGRFIGRLLSLLAVPDGRIPAAGTEPLVLLSCSDVDRGMVEDGLRFAPLLEGIRLLLADLGYTTANLTHPYAAFRANKIKGGSLTLNRKIFAIRLLALAVGIVHREKAQAWRAHAEACVYVRVLQSLRPKMVISIQPAPALCDAAKRCGVRVVEVLHGTHVPATDRVFRDYMSNSERFLADAFVVFDDVTFATWKALCMGRSMNVLRAEDPWLHACRQRQLRLDLGGGTKVLVTLQWGYDGEREWLRNIVPNGILHPAIETAIERGAARNVTFLLRMHPVQMTAPGYRHHRRYVERLSHRFPNVNVEVATSFPLPALLDEVDAHLTMSSSAVGEAATAGVPSLALCPTLKPGGAHAGLFAELARQGLVTYGELDAEAILKWIANCMPRGMQRRPAYQVDEAGASQRRFYSELLQWGGRARGTCGAERVGDSMCRQSP